MLATTDEIKAAWLSPSRQLSIRIKMNDVTYGSEEIASLSFDSGSISGEVFQIGSTYMNSVQIVFPSIIETVDEDLEVIPELGVLINGEYQYTKLGHFFIDEFERNRNSNTTSITATDKMRFMEGQYESKLTYPKAYKDVALEVANLAGVEINPASFSSLGLGAINKPEGYTHRQAIGLIAQFEGGFASFNRNGELEIRRLAPTDFQIDPESYLLKGFTKNEVSYRIGGISVRTGEEETDVIRVGSTNGSQIELENKVMTQVLLDQIWELVKTLNYFPYELKWRGCPPLEAGDWIYVTAKDGTRYSVPNLSYSITFNGGMSAESKATTNSSSQATYKYRGTLNQRVDTVESILGSNNWNTNYYDQTEPPNPKEGDTWFKPNGQDTEIWVYKNVDGKLDWVKEISSAPNTELVEAVNQAVADSAQAAQDANDAVEKANQANETAGFANNAAQTAVEQSANAVSQASNASIAAQEAIQNSANAVNQAQQALNDATELLNTVDEMQGTIASISTTMDEVNNQLAVKVNQTDFDKLSGTVSSQGTAITANANAIALKADSSTVNTIKGTFESLQSKLSVQAGQIQGLVSKTDGLTTDLAQLSLKADGLDLSVAQVQNELAGQKAGYRNLIVNSGNFQTLAPWYGGVLDTTTFPFPTIKGTEILAQPESLALKPGTEYVAVMRAYFTTDISISLDFPFHIYVREDGGTNQGGRRTISLIGGNRKAIPNTWETIIIKFKTIATNKKITFKPHLYHNNWNGAERWLQSVMLVEGNVIPQDWVPAIEDQATSTELAILSVRADQIQATVAANKTELDGKLSTQQSQINQNATSIQSLVTKTDGTNTALAQLQIEAGKIGTTVAEVQKATTWQYMTGTLDLDNFTAQGKYFLASTSLNNCPSAGWGYLSVETGTGDGARIIQTYQQDNNNALTHQRIWNGTVWSSWKQIANDTDIATVTAKYSSLEQTVNGFQATVTNQISGLTSQQTQLADQIQSTVTDLEGVNSANNLLTGFTFSNNKDVNLTTGEVTAGSRTIVDDFVPVQPNTQYTFSRPEKLKNVGFRGYTSSKAYIGAVANSAGAERITTFTTPANCYFIKFIDESNKLTKGYRLQVSAATQSQITQLATDINLRVEKGDVINQINVDTTGVLIAGEKVHITGQTTIDNGIIKTAMIADAAINDAKIQNASISSAKIISLDANKIVANSLSAITTNTGTLNVTGWINLNSANYGIRSSYDYGDSIDGAYNPRWFTGEYVLGYRYQKFLADVYNLNSDGSKGSFKNYAETFVGGDYFKMRQYDNKTNKNLKGRVDIVGGKLEINDSWYDGTATGIHLYGDGRSWFESIATFSGGMYVASPNNKGIETGRIDAPSNYDSFQINSNVSSLTNAMFGTHNIYFNQSRTDLADFRIGKDGSATNGGRVVQSMAVYNRTYSMSANAVVTNEGTLGRATSARKYKTDIQTAYDVIEDAKRVLDINPASWIDKGELADGHVSGRYYGFIADEFDELGLNEVVIYQDGQVESLAYDRISMYHNVILTEHEKEIQTLKQKISLLEDKIRDLQVA